MRCALPLLVSLPLLFCTATGRDDLLPPQVPLATVMLDGDSAADMIPAGHGSLRLDDITVRVLLTGIQVRLLPLDESVIRTLSSDAYRTLRDLVAENQAEIVSISERHGARRPSLWYVSFYGLRAESPLSPMEVVVGSGGRDYRPLDVVPLSTGFGQQRIRQREIHSAIYVFEEGIDVNQPLVITVETVRNTRWNAIMRTIERERALVRSRAAAPR